MSARLVQSRVVGLAGHACAAHGRGVRCFFMVSGRIVWQTPRLTMRATHGARSRFDHREKRLFELEDAIDQISDRLVIRVVYPEFDQLVAQPHGKVGHASQVEALELIERCVETAQEIADVIVELGGGAPHSPNVGPGAPATAPATPNSWTKTCTLCRLHAPGGAVASRLGKRCDRCGTGRQALSSSMPNKDLMKVAGEEEGAHHGPAIQLRRWRFLPK